ncbi:MAG TPA: hypothetical protein VIG78_06085, partial [Gemmatimonadaceae bacterium]
GATLDISFHLPVMIASSVCEVGNRNQSTAQLDVAPDAARLRSGGRAASENQNLNGGARPAPHRIFPTLLRH